jgi:hypothetical protein
VRLLAALLFEVAHEKAGVFALGGVEGHTVGAGEVLAVVDQVILIALPRFLADVCVVDFDRFRDQLLVGKVHP